MEGNNKKNVLLIIMGVLIIAELISGLATLGTDTILADLAMQIPLVFISLYGFWFYKKPHGNMLKIAMLILAAVIMSNAVRGLYKGWNFNNQALRILVSSILIYVAGRLNRIDQNKYLLPVAFIILLATDNISVFDHISSYTFVYLFSWFGEVISTLTLMIAYFVRYKEHKEAGLMDAPKTK